jgi:hypothetical protein
VKSKNHCFFLFFILITKKIEKVKKPKFAICLNLVFFVFFEKKTRREHNREQRLLIPVCLAESVWLAESACLSG